MAIQQSIRTYWATRISTIINSRIGEIRKSKKGKVNSIINKAIKDIESKYDIADKLKEYRELLKRKDELITQLEPIISVIKCRIKRATYGMSYDESIREVAIIESEEVLNTGPLREATELKDIKTTIADKLQNANNIKELRAVLISINEKLAKFNLEQLNIEV